MVKKVLPKEVTLEVLNPMGLTEISKEPAPRLASLNGKTICEAWYTGSYFGERTYPVIRELLKARFPDAKIIPYTEFPMGMMPTKAEETVSLVKEKGCDAVIVGNGA
ncbi:hypothetical protein ACFLT4_07560 [Chloroflexota bacterium]